MISELCTIMIKQRIYLGSFVCTILGRVSEGLAKIRQLLNATLQLLTYQQPAELSCYDFGREKRG